MFQIRLVQTIFSIEILQLKSVLISFDINTFHFSLHINELNMVENSSQESNPVPTSILILAGRGSLRIKVLGEFRLLSDILPFDYFRQCQISHSPSEIQKDLHPNVNVTY